VLVALMAVFAALSPAFLTAGNLTILVKHVAINAILAIGMTFVILTGGIDLSVGSIAGLAGMIAGGLIHTGLVLPMFGVVVYFQVWLVIAIALLAGGLAGGVNGVLVSRLHVAPFIATLGTMYAARGAALLLSNGATFPNLYGKPELANTGFPLLGSGSLARIPVPIWLMLALGAAAAFIAARTPFGRHVYAVGGNEKSAKTAGIGTKKIIVLVYVISGLLAALGGLILTARTTSGLPQAGQSYELDAIAAVVIGGTSLSGGVGTIQGTLFGALIIGVINNGLNLLGVSSFYQQVVKGCIIIGAVLLDTARKSRE
jgi:erythritol transport system permease protein